MAEASEKSDKTTAVRRRRRKEARPGEIIDAGMVEFAENGFAGTRLDDVARRAGVAKGTIYLYFKNKEELFQAAVQSRVQSRIEEVSSFIDDYEGSSETMIQLVIARLYHEMLNSDTSVLMRVIIAEGHRFPELKRRYYETAIGQGQSVLDKLVKRGLDRGEFRRGPANEFPRLIIAPVIMAAIWKLTFQDIEPLDVDRQLAAHIDLLLNGLKA